MVPQKGEEFEETVKNYCVLIFASKMQVKSGKMSQW